MVEEEAVGAVSAIPVYNAPRHPRDVDEEEDEDEEGGQDQDERRGRGTALAYDDEDDEGLDYEEGDEMEG